MKNPLELQRVAVSVAFIDDAWGSHVSEIELPLEAGRENLEKGASGAIPMLLESAREKFLNAQAKRTQEIAEAITNEAAQVKEVSL